MKQTLINVGKHLLALSAVCIGVIGALAAVFFFTRFVIWFTTGESLL